MTFTVLEAEMKQFLGTQDGDALKAANALK